MPLLSLSTSTEKASETPSTEAPAANVRTIAVLFICVGNSCRSPMAESVMRSLTDGRPQSGLAWHIDSAAIADWNVGRAPEPRAQLVLAANGLPRSEHRTRQITADDFRRFDYIFGMDDLNMRDLRAIEPTDSTAKVELLARYDYGHPEVIADPYFERGTAGFEQAFIQIDRSCRNFIESVRALAPVAEE